MSHRRKQSLITRLESILGLAVGSAMLVAMLLIMSQEVITRKQSVSDASLAWLSTLAVQAESPLAFDDQRTANELLLAASVYPNLQAVYILRTDGTVFASHVASRQRALAVEDMKRIGVSGYFDDALSISRPVMMSGNELGVVVARVDLMPMWRSMLEFAIAIFIALGASGLVAGLLARQFLRRALAPITGLKRVMQDISRGEDFTVRARVAADDEVGALTTVFNEMLDQIVHRDAQLAENNARLVALKEAAEQSSTMKSEFLALMSHELRTPMAGVLGMLSLSLRGQMDRTARERVELASTNASALLQIVNDLLDISKIEAGKLDLEQVDFALKPMLDDAMRLLHERARQKSIFFEMDLDPAVPPYLVGDPTRIRQVLLNLVSNAIKFTENGSVTLSVRLAQTSSVRPEQTLPIAFSVTDSGIGISAEAQTRMFQKFEQADVSTTRKFGGTGLGLSISKQLVELMGGTIGLRSELGVGSTFFFELPLRQGNKPAEEVHVTIGTHDYQLNILVAEDAETNQLIIETLLSEMGHAVTLVEDGQQALEALTTAHFDLILMDGRMPVMDGLEATQHIRRGYWQSWIFPDPGIPIVALTANASAEDRLRFLDAGMNDFLTKPVDERALYRALSAIIEQKLAAGVTLQPHVSADSSALAALDALNQALPADKPADFVVAESTEKTAVTPGIAAPLTESDSKAPLAERMLEAFWRQLPAQISDIDHAVRGGNWPHVATKVHGIKGSVAYVYPDSEAFKLCAALEHDADAGRVETFMANWSTLKVLFDGIRPKAQVASRPPAVVEVDPLMHLSSLDYATALRQMGGRRSLLIDILQRFQLSQADAVEKLNQLLANGEVDEAARLIHTLKGLTASIGAGQVADCASRIEQQLNSSDVESRLPDALTQALDDAMKQLFADLSHALPRGGDRIVQPAKQQSQEVTAIVRELVDLLEANSGDAPFVFATNRIALTEAYGDLKVTALAERLDAFDFDGARRSLVDIARVE